MELASLWESWEHPLATCTMWGDSERQPPKKWVLTRHQTCGHQVLDFTFCRTVRNTLLWFKSHPVYVFCFSSMNRLRYTLYPSSTSSIIFPASGNIWIWGRNSGTKVCKELLMTKSTNIRLRIRPGLWNWPPLTPVSTLLPRSMRCPRFSVPLPKTSQSSTVCAEFQGDWKSCFCSTVTACP